LASIATTTACEPNRSAIWLISPSFADCFVRCEALQGLQPLGEVESGKEGGEVIP